MEEKSKVKYVDGFVLVIPKNKVTEYLKMAREGKKMWMKYGALDYKECIGDDMNPDMEGMPILTFPKLVKAKKNETVWFSYIGYKSKAHRNEVNKKVMAEMDKKYENQEDMPMPFDMKKMAFGGFKVEVSN